MFSRHHHCVIEWSYRSEFNLGTIWQLSVIFLLPRETRTNLNTKKKKKKQDWFGCYLKCLCWTAASNIIRNNHARNLCDKVIWTISFTFYCFRIFFLRNPDGSDKIHKRNSYEKPKNIVANTDNIKMCKLPTCSQKVGKNTNTHLIYLQLRSAHAQFTKIANILDIS